MLLFIFFLLILSPSFNCLLDSNTSVFPMVINTWPFTSATNKAWQTFLSGGSRIDAIEKGCTQCEIDRCDGSVGYGGSPDESGETTLDAMIMDGETMKVGSVGCLRRIKGAISVARCVMDYTTHTLLVGDLATSFAKQMGFKEESLSTNDSTKIYEDWKKSNCQPNFWKNVDPNNTQSCGPYHRATVEKRYQVPAHVGHDTIAMVAFDKDGKIASGASTNGLTHKIPGRVGDSPITGAGAYSDHEGGGCGATGDGDVMMRFLPCFYAVEKMKDGHSPQEAAVMALRRILKYETDFQGALFTVNMKGEIGAVGHGWTFYYSYVNNLTKAVQIVRVDPI
jgi:N4-(beta-N-acetylglucosaminyl)-L-asparaginase